MFHRLVDANSTAPSALSCFQLTLCETPSAPALLRALLAQPEHLAGRVGHLLAQALVPSSPDPPGTLAFHAETEALKI